MSTQTVQSIAYFMVSVKNAHGGQTPIGAIANGAKLQCDERVAAFFPVNTKAREELLKACRWCKGERITPNYVDMEIRRGSVVLEVRVGCIRQR